MSSIACQKTWTLMVTGVPGPMRFYYWTLDEPAGNYVDSVNSVVLGANFNNPGTGSGEVVGDRVAGLFGNAVRFHPRGMALGDLQMMAGNTVAGTAALALPTPPLGFSMAGWLKIDALDTNYGAAGYISTGNVGMFLGFSTGAGVFFRWTDNTQQEDLVVPTPTLGTWFFFHLFYDSSSARFGYSIDNGAETLGTAAPVFVPSVFGDAYAWQGGFATPCDYTADEFCLRLDDRLTLAQVAYLYNGGTGRTWPIVLP